KKGEPEPDRAVLEKLVEVLPAKLRAALDVIELAEVSAQAQDSVGAIRKLWQSTQKDRPLLSAWESLKEYARLADRSERAEGGASRIALVRARDWLPGSAGVARDCPWQGVGRGRGSAGEGDIDAGRSRRAARARSERPRHVASGSTPAHYPRGVHLSSLCLI